LKNALCVLHQGISNNTGHDGDIQACLALSVRALTNTFNKTYTTPLSLFLPPDIGQLGAVRDKLKIQKIKVLKTTSTTIIVEEIQRSFVAQAKKWTFVFCKNEWVCGSDVLFF
jgi:hypothetical protein